MSILQDLAARAEAAKPVRVAVIGAGEMGTDIVTRLSLMPGMQLAVMAEVRESAALHAIEIAHRPQESAKVCGKLSDVEDIIRTGKTAVVTDSTFAYTADQVDVIIDATGNPGVGAELATLAMEHRKHIVMMNVEADITVGTYLVEQAKRAGVVYTVGAGDEPSSTMEIVNFVRSLGYPIVAAGKGKNNPMKFDAVPADYEEEAAARTQKALPIGLAERAVVTQPIKAGEFLTYANCRPDERMKIAQLRRAQDQMLIGIESTKIMT
jgi:predicted homoserine dehydrogenase-like protein